VVCIYIVVNCGSRLKFLTGGFRIEFTNGSVLNIGEDPMQMLSFVQSDSESDSNTLIGWQATAASIDRSLDDNGQQEI
jgi:hypothetical protein